LYFSTGNNFWLLSYCSKGYVNPGILGDAIVSSIAKAHGKTSAQVMLRFLVQQDVVVIPKSTNRERIFQNAAVRSLKF